MSGLKLSEKRGEAKKGDKGSGESLLPELL
jgi:hypothetical protein